jgi:hypothetical protein
MCGKPKNKIIKDGQQDWFKPVYKMAVRSVVLKPGLFATLKSDNSFES